MTASTPEKLSEQDLDLLVRWMTGDYSPSTVPDYPNQLGTVQAAMAAPAIKAPVAVTPEAPVAETPSE